MERRTFLAGAGSLALPLLLPLPSLAQTGIEMGIPESKLQRLSLSVSSYRANYDHLSYSVPTAQPRLSHLSFPRFARETFGLRHIELWDQQFGPEGHTVEQCRKVRAAADAAGVSIISVEVEDLPNLGQTDKAAHAEAITNLKAWLDKGHILGTMAIRVNASRGRDPVDINALVDTLGHGAEYAKSLGMRLMLENHGGYTSSIPDMISIIKQVNNDHLRIEVDWGAGSPPLDRYEAIQMAMPYVFIVSAKGEVFDPVSYEHTSYDIPRIVRASEAGGYRGIYSIELWEMKNPPRNTDSAVRWMMKAIADNMA